jgi:polar amino acid transport system substrate-binding protein
VRLDRPFALLTVTLLLTACAAPGATTKPTGTPAAVATPTPTAAATPTAVPATPTAVPATATPAPPTAIADACVRDSLTLKNPGRLTLSTDIPAFPPWWGGDASQQYDNEPADGSPWSATDFSAEPYSKEGFEGSTAYAIANAMGFADDEVDWIANPVFEQAFAPGEKPFDFHMAQISIRPERALAVAFTDPYFDSNQSLLALTPNDITGAASLADLKAYKLGAAANTTSFELIDTVIQPTTEPSVYPDNATALQALQNGQIDGLVVDLSTAFYMRDAELEDFDTPDPEGTIVGQFGPPAKADQVGAVLELGNPLVACVNQAIAQIKADGTLQGLLDQWINTGQDVPFFE